jgi:hypothetical protein
MRSNYRDDLVATAKAHTGRSNARTHLHLTADNGRTHDDTVFGNGFGAFVKCVDRCIVALTGWNPLNTRFTVDCPDRWALKNRTTGEVVLVHVDEVAA